MIIQNMSNRFEYASIDLFFLRMKRFQFVVEFGLMFDSLILFDDEGDVRIVIYRNDFFCWMINEDRNLWGITCSASSLMSERKRTFLVDVFNGFSADRIIRMDFFVRSVDEFVAIFFTRLYNVMISFQYVD